MSRPHDSSKADAEPAESSAADSRIHSSTDPEPTAKPITAAQPVMPKIVPFSELARCGEEIWISHQGNLYRLQSTKQGKLILTK